MDIVPDVTAVTMMMTRMSWITIITSCPLLCCGFYPFEYLIPHICFLAVIQKLKKLQRGAQFLLTRNSTREL